MRTNKMADIWQLCNCSPMWVSSWKDYAFVSLFTVDRAAFVLSVHSSFPCLSLSQCLYIKIYLFVIFYLGTILFWISFTASHHCLNVCLSLFWTVFSFFQVVFSCECWPWPIWWYATDWLFLFTVCGGSRFEWEPLRGIPFFFFSISCRRTFSSATHSRCYDLNVVDQIVFRLFLRRLFK